MKNLTRGNEKNAIIASIKEMICDYNKQYKHIFLESNDKKREYCCIIIKSMDRHKYKNYSDFMYKRLRLSENCYPNRYPDRCKYILGIDELLEYEQEFIDRMTKTISEKPEFSSRLKVQLQNFEKGIEILKKFKKEEDYFFLLLDKKITIRVLNKTAYNYEFRINDNFQYYNFRQILQSIEDIECEYIETEICVQDRYYIMENERISRIYQKMHERELNELRKLKLMMFNSSLESKPEEINNNRFNQDSKIIYKQCNECGAWHNSAYNRCAPCNNFKAINDK